METSNNTIKCPHCSGDVDVSMILAKQIKDRYENDYNVRASELKKQYDKKSTDIQKLQDELKSQQERINESVEKATIEKLRIEKINIEKKLRLQIEQENSDQIKSFQEQLEQKSKETKELNKLKAEFQKVQREKLELKDALEADMQLRLNDELSEARKKMKEEIEKKATMKIAEKDILINQLREQLENAHKKVEQGSMQLQGEAQEKAIEEFLQENFPNDEIVEIHKGVKGGDCIHNVMNSSGQNCGLIYYESKRSKEFQKSWIEKFKADMRAKKVTFGVIVTDCYPKDMERMGQRNGIWICSWEEFKSLCFVLRESVLLLYQVQISQENRGGKMEMLYQYLTGAEFHSHIEAIVEGFVQMNDDLARERRSFEGHWKQREKQIQKVLFNTSQMYHSIRGIAGNAVNRIKELDYDNQKVLPEKAKGKREIKK
jgi:hypothetical protein